MTLYPLDPNDTVECLGCHDCDKRIGQWSGSKCGGTGRIPNPEGAKVEIQSDDPDGVGRWFYRTGTKLSGPHATRDDALAAARRAVGVKS